MSQSPSTTPPNSRRSFGSLWQTYGTSGILLLLLLGCGIASPQYFLAKDNLVQVLVQSAVLILLACGEFFPILIAGIDLSVGSVLGLTGIFTAKLMLLGMPWWAASLLGGVVAGGVLGAINGVLVNLTQLHPFIITLGTAAIYRGVALILSNASSIYGFDPQFGNVLAGNLGPLPVPVLVACVVAVLLLFVAQWTRLGRNIYALGGNPHAALYSGINIRLHTLVVFIFSGVCAGIAGLVSTARTGAAEPNAGLGFETFAIASVIIGGTSFFGGRGWLAGVVAGGLIIGVINNFLNIMDVQSYYQQVVMGSLIILAVAVDKLFSRRR